jgi:hypothetical protein
LCLLYNGKEQTARKRYNREKFNYYTMKKLIMHKLYISLIISFSIYFLSQISVTQAATSPYPPSQVITDITWHTDTHVWEAPGSDLWPNTWGADGNIYVSWGDGGGFGGTNSDGRTSVGFGRIEGPPESYQGNNVFGGKNPENTIPNGHPFDCPSGCGKSLDMLSVDGTLYSWIHMQDGVSPDYSIKLAWSDDLAASWQLSSWSFPTGNGNFKPRTFANFGKDYAGARDNYVYFYGFNQGEEGKGYMGRVLKTEIKDKTKYEYYAGLDGNGDPIWSSNINQRQSYFYDPNSVNRRIGYNRVIYNAPLNRYILTGNYDGGGGFLHI